MAMIDPTAGAPEFESILSELEGRGPVQVQAKYARTSCPMHDGEDQSAFVLFKSGVGRCFSQCGRSFSPAEIAEKLEIDLVQTKHLTLDAFLAAFRLPASIAGEFSLRTSNYGGRSWIVIPYLDEHGELLRNRKRLSLHGGQKHAWDGYGGRTHPFGLHRLEQIRRFGRTLIVEGETDVLACAAGHVPAIGLPGSNTWREEYRRYFDGVEVAIWQEPGDAGRKFVDAIGQDLPTARVLRHPSAKDPAELWMMVEDDEFAPTIERMWEAAPKVGELKGAELEQEREFLSRHAGELINDPDFFDRLCRDIETSGYVGEVAPALAAYIGLTSRMLKKPMNLLLIAQSAAGKNFAVTTALKFIPDSAFQKVDAGSPGSFIYDETPLVHKGFILTEFDSAPQGDGAFASAMRTLFEESRLVYQTTIDDHGERRVVRVIREGPIAVITTAVKAPEIQSDTRLLPVPVDDGKEQIKQIALRTAINAESEESDPSFDFDLYRSFQRYLDLGGPYRVIVPFATALFRAIPDEVAGATRWNRDSQQLLTAIKAVAVVNQARRRRDRAAIIAELGDYEIVLRAFEPSFRAAAAQGITQADRDAYGVIAAEPGLTNANLADRLGVRPPSATYRTSRLRKAGLIVNTAGRGKTKWEVEGPLPESVGLPSIESVRRQLEIDSNPLIASPVAAGFQQGLEDSSEIPGDPQTDIEVI